MDLAESEEYEAVYEQYFDPVEEVLEDIAAGKIVIVTDAADRENEGDFVMAAEKATPQAINFMLKHGRGLLCVPVTRERLRELGIPLMVEGRQDSFGTAFTVSVDAVDGLRTGISTAERARTVLDLADPGKGPNAFCQPGHVNPLEAKPGGVLCRAGHTEAAVDLARLAGCQPAGAICEILKDDGTMARLPHLVRMKEELGLKLCSIASLIEYRRRREKLVERERVVQMPTEYGAFQLHLYRTTVGNQHHMALTMGDITDGTPVLVRMHSECLTGDVFGSLRCDCGPQLHNAMQQIASAGRGVLVYMRQEGRGIGLSNKIHAYHLQEQGYDTVEANQKLGFRSDLREYGLGAQILIDLGIKRLRLLTNNPKKIIGLEGYGLEVVEQLPIVVSPNPYNERYLRTKQEKMGHLYNLPKQATHQV